MEISPFASPASSPRHYFPPPGEKELSQQQPVSLQAPRKVLSVHPFVVQQNPLIGVLSRKLIAGFKDAEKLAAREEKEEEDIHAFFDDRLYSGDDVLACANQDRCVAIRTGKGLRVGVCKCDCIRCDDYGTVMAMPSCRDSCICLYCAMESLLSTKFKMVFCSKCLQKHWLIEKDKNWVCRVKNNIQRIASIVDHCRRSREGIRDMLYGTHMWHLLEFVLREQQQSIPIIQGSPLGRLYEKMYKVFGDDLSPVRAANSFLQNVLLSEEQESFFYPMVLKLVGGDHHIIMQMKKTHLEDFNYWLCRMPRRPVTFDNEDWSRQDLIIQRAWIAIEELPDLPSVILPEIIVGPKVEVIGGSSSSNVACTAFPTTTVKEKSVEVIGGSSSSSRPVVSFAEVVCDHSMQYVGLSFVAHATKKRPHKTTNQQSSGGVVKRSRKKTGA